MRLFKISLILSLLLYLMVQSSCNIFYVTASNFPVFFSTPRKVYNKIKKPVRDDVRLSALWIGHSTVLIQMDDKVIITDPLLTETAGEFARRVVEPGIEIEDIPRCDLILVSHSHFDHLSYGSLEILEDSSGGTELVFPEGLEDYLPGFDFNFTRLKNNDGYRYGYRGESKIVNGVKVTSVFARHWGGRYAADGYFWGENAFTGFIIEYGGLCVYFAGDTGYDSLNFRMIGDEFKVDLACIPIGPCAECRQNGTRNHVFPPDALRIFRDINAKYMLPIHYATLKFAQAEPIVPVFTLRSMAASEKIIEFMKIPDIGQQVVLSWKDDRK